MVEGDVAAKRATCWLNFTHGDSAVRVKPAACGRVVAFLCEMFAARGVRQDGFGEIMHVVAVILCTLCRCDHCDCVRA